MLLGATMASAQIDTERRQILHLGYDASLEGHAPIAAYAFYYLNRPQFLRDDMTLRMAVAPVYFDSELGWAHLLGPNTDLGIGVAGGGFADSYREIRGGKYYPKESFDGHGGGMSVSLYHRFNPTQRVPRFGVLRAGMHYSLYSAGKDTSGQFDLPENHPSANIRVGLRLGGKEPDLFPALAMELAIWAESYSRGDDGPYGYDGDRELNSYAQKFYAHGYLAYTFERGDNANISMTAGTSINADRFSAYRLGSMLPLVAEYPLILPGYFFQELSADQFILWHGRYAVTLDEKKQWQIAAMASTATVSFIDEQDQPERWFSGVGGGVAYQSSKGTWKTAVTYGYGIDAIRDGDRGSHVVGVVLQLDLEQFLNKQRSEPFWWWQ